MLGMSGRGRGLPGGGCAVKPMPNRDRTLEVRCGNCRARFIAWYGEEDAPTESVEVDECGLCGGDTFKNDVFKDSVIPLLAQVTARGVKRE